MHKFIKVLRQYDEKYGNSPLTLIIYNKFKYF
ncbi:MAG: hypothetical protein IEMM0006_1492 [bacterium]|nr:MAG: hypothetical protein IEMM0006_1492 [bacterium]